MKQDPRFLKHQVDSLQESIDRMRATVAAARSQAPPQALNLGPAMIEAGRLLRNLDAGRRRIGARRVDC